MHLHPSLAASKNNDYDLENFSSSDFRLRNFQYLTLDLEIILIVDSGLRNFLKFDFGL